MRVYVQQLAESEEIASVFACQPWSFPDNLIKVSDTDLRSIRWDTEIWMINNYMPAYIPKKCLGILYTTDIYITLITPQFGMDCGYVLHWFYRKFYP